MNDKPNWRVARLDDIERRGRDIPVREHLGIHAFGINAFTPSEDGTLIGEHDEAGSGQEELYIVLDGNATFEIDGEEFDAPTGTLVFVAPEARRKATGEGTVLAIGATPGEAYEGVDWGDAWPFHSESMKAYPSSGTPTRWKRSRRPRTMPDHAGVELQLRVFRNARGRHRRRDVRPPPAGGRAASSVPRRRPQRRRLRRCPRRPPVRAGASLSGPLSWPGISTRERRTRPDTRSGRRGRRCTRQPLEHERLVGDLRMRGDEAEHARLLEAEARVVRGNTLDHDGGLARFLGAAERVPDQPCSHTDALAVRPNRHRREVEDPRTGSAVNADPAQHHVRDHTAQESSATNASSGTNCSDARMRSTNAATSSG